MVLAALCSRNDAFTTPCYHSGHQIERDCPTIPLCPVRLQCLCSRFDHHNNKTGLSIAYGRDRATAFGKRNLTRGDRAAAFKKKSRLLICLSPSVWRHNQISTTRH
ncbi:hypothetical protein FIBSPDRAFT_559973 [Athelia psychrophila]|uniref:Uncharacterized protein n=1 Tax=Athelia psychrophila TaxID=1759441 RepID=A0A166IA65_9AGAM|nr:hypothetical protein FIBSPDRAFT_559973 [Fibularhizoctonia sp. CBS 109695]